ncbi:MAG TPA: hypothetical protein VMA74_00915 [Dyella sp.]|uniref:hypothetical protein n=1 Tax=Dyella sp. TaxID=1869338 RepID=UPI002C922063|nr:hypothetical protein [Dyella sp.]HUB88267.1 hypothetical protein [Dyella sp.]
MMKKEISYLPVFLLAFGLVSLARASDNDSLLMDKKQHPVVLFSNVDAGDGNAYQAVVVRSSIHAGPSDAALTIYRGKEVVFSLSPHLQPISLFATSELDPQLVSLWISGNGVYTACIFAFEKGRVNKVLEASSMMMPEFVYAQNDPGDYKQRVIFSNLQWVVDKSGKSVQQPVSADVYVWDGAKYVAHKSIPWRDRFNLH